MSETSIGTILAIIISFTIGLFLIGVLFYCFKFKNQKILQNSELLEQKQRGKMILPGIFHPITFNYDFPILFPEMNENNLINHQIIN